MTADIEFLKELQKELRTQDTDVQAAPRFWGIGDYRIAFNCEGEEEEEHFVHENTMFLTKKGAKEHLEINYYHYSKRAHTFAMTAWRSPQVEQLMKILENCDFDSMK